MKNIVSLSCQTPPERRGNLSPHNAAFLYAVIYTKEASALHESGLHTPCVSGV